MKFGFILGLVLALGNHTFAQGTDTLGYADFLQGTSSLYESPNGGYAFGVNGYNDVAKAQSFSNENSFVLTEVLLEFGDVTFESGDSTSSIRVNVYDNYGNGITSLGQADSIAPDSVLAFVDVPVYELSDDGSLTSVDFSSTVLAIFSRFSVGVEFSNLAIGDTVGLVSTTDGDAADSFNAWELSQAGNWVTVEQPSYSWGLEVDFAIFPVIDEDHPAGVEDQVQYSFSLFPNPCIDKLAFTVDVQKSFVTIIYDVTGKELQRSIHNTGNASLDVSALPPGVYSVALTVEDSKFSQRFIKL